MFGFFHGMLHFKKAESANTRIKLIIEKIKTMDPAKQEDEIEKMLAAHLSVLPQLQQKVSELQAELSKKMVVIYHNYAMNTSQLVPLAQSTLDRYVNEYRLRNKQPSAQEMKMSPSNYATLVKFGEKLLSIVKLSLVYQCVIDLISRNYIHKNSNLTRTYN